MALCPECESDLDLDRDEIEEGDIVTCYECDSRFEVVITEPLELAKLEAEEDDEYDEDDEKDDDEDEDEDE